MGRNPCCRCASRYFLREPNLWPTVAKGLTGCPFAARTKSPSSAKLAKAAVISSYRDPHNRAESYSTTEARKGQTHDECLLSTQRVGTIDPCLQSKLQIAVSHLLFSFCRSWVAFTISIPMFPKNKELVPHPVLRDWCVTCVLATRLNFPVPLSPHLLLNHQSLHESQLAQHLPPKHPLATVLTVEVLLLR